MFNVDLFLNTCFTNRSEDFDGKVKIAFNHFENRQYGEASKYFSYLYETNPSKDIFLFFVNLCYRFNSHNEITITNLLEKTIEEENLFNDDKKDFLLAFLYYSYLHRLYLCRDDLNNRLISGLLNLYTYRIIEKTNLLDNFQSYPETSKVVIAQLKRSCYKHSVNKYSKYVVDRYKNSSELTIYNDIEDTSVIYETFINFINAYKGLDYLSIAEKRKSNQGSMLIGYWISIIFAILCCIFCTIYLFTFSEFYNNHDTFRLSFAETLSNSWIQQAERSSTTMMLIALIILDVSYVIHMLIMVILKEKIIVRLFVSSVSLLSCLLALASLIYLVAMGNIYRGAYTPQFINLPIIAILSLVALLINLRNLKQKKNRE